MLIYQGRGRFIVGVPARDLSPGDIARLAGSERPAALRARLIATGLYAPARKEVARHV